MVSSLNMQLREASENMHLHSNGNRSNTSSRHHSNNDSASAIKLHDAKMQKFKQKVFNSTIFFP